ncbi:crossover junction endodeoxyribonuclease RuvC [Marispirochaeta sp.]|jgi:crossover junction endodeoxyribonuclease RuvC|uniref:crossover junction endodeoxyribonuclease RuvC n=1 Tax=Marispirochaeta sp. TaxID=2038653 RepID=UPI0029C7729F|nr:crossover junction endodeoxyribonuclease RuvC [Marispirochaeta sp.]
MRVLGIDPGLANTGWGIIDAGGGKLRHVSHGTITTSSQEMNGRRLLAIRNELIEIVRTYKPDIAGIESIYFSRNQTSAIPVAQAMGVVLVTCEELDLRVESFSPPRIKQAVVGVGRADKEQMQELLRLILGLKEPPRPDHAADALAAAVCRYNYLSPGEDAKKAGM